MIYNFFHGTCYHCYIILFAANFYCIQHIGLAKPVRKSRKRSYDEKELRARLAAQGSDEDMEGKKCFSLGMIE